MRSRCLRPILLALSLSCITPAAAEAARVGFVSPTEVTFRGDPGEANVARFTFDATGVVFGEASGAPLSAGERCATIDAVSVRCEFPIARIRIETGDGDDRITGSGTWPEVPQDIVLDGGSGNDVVLGTRNYEELHGGGGRDVLRGGGGPDSLSDDDGADGDADVLDGGGAYDVVSYADHGSGITVDLDDSHGPDGDVLTGQESVVGSEGDDRLSAGHVVGSELDGGGGNDRLRGGRGPDRLRGGDGRDVLVGSEGRDKLVGGDGADRLDGGAGADVIEIRDDRGDVVRCGGGLDLVRGLEENDFNGNDEDVGPDRQDRLAEDCERTRVDHVAPSELRLQPLRFNKHGARLANACKPCQTGRVRVLASGRMLGSARLRGRRVVNIRWRRPLSSRRAIEVAVVWSFTSPYPGPDVAYTLRVRVGS